jgi:hypothetical protein
MKLLNLDRLKAKSFPATSASDIAPLFRSAEANIVMVRHATCRDISSISNYDVGAGRGLVTVVTNEVPVHNSELVR